LSHKNTVALIIPALNEEATVQLTLDSIFASSRLPDEIIIADGNSSDDTVKLVKRYSEQGVHIQVVNNPKIFAGAGRNVAVEVATSDILLLVDFGNTLDPLWIEKMVEPFESDPAINTVCGTFRPIVNSNFEHCVAAIHYHENCLHDKLTQQEKLAIAENHKAPGALSIGIKREFWIQMKGMPDWLRSAEDKLFGRKLIASKAKKLLVFDAFSNHHMRETPAQLFNQAFIYSRGIGRTRSVRMHFIKLLGFYGLMTIMLIALPFTLWSIATFFAVLSLYVLHSGLRKLIIIDNGIKNWRYLYLTPLVLFPRDIGTLTGNIVGLCEWLTKPHFRKNFLQYLNSASMKEYPLISR